MMSFRYKINDSKITINKNKLSFEAIGFGHLVKI